LHTGVLGIAIRTLVARAIVCLVIVYLLLDVRLKLHIRKSFIYKFDYETIKKILNIGIPYGFENSMFYLGRIIVLSLVSLFGTASIAANAVGGTIGMFQILPGMAIGTGLSVVVARCIGANDLLQAKF